MIQLLAEQFAMQDPPFTSEKVAFRRAAALSYNNCHAGDVLERLQQLCISPPLFCLDVFLDALGMYDAANTLSRAVAIAGPVLKGGPAEVGHTSASQ